MVWEIFDNFQLFLTDPRNKSREQKVGAKYKRGDTVEE